MTAHDMRQASRASGYTAFFLINSERAGGLVEYSPSEELSQSPKGARTEQYISGRFG